MGENPTTTAKDECTDQTTPIDQPDPDNTNNLHSTATICDDIATIKKTAKSILLSGGKISHEQRRDCYKIVAIANHFNNIKTDGNLRRVTDRFKKDPLTQTEINELETEIEQRIKDLKAIQREIYAEEQKKAEIEALKNAHIDALEDFDIMGIDVEKTFLEAFHVNSSSCDDDIARIILLSFIGGRELTGDGLHCNVNAPPGSGKSIATSSATHALPTEAVYIGAMTDHAVLYDHSLQPGTMIKTDEAQGRSETLENIIKEAISSFQTGIAYRTVQRVDNENQTIIKQLSPRLTFITASVDVQGSDQIRSRFLPLAPKQRTDSVNALVTQFRLNKRETGIPKLYTNEKVLKSRKVLQHFMRRTFKARIPNASKIIQYSEIGDQRAQEWLENALLCHAVLNYKKRPHHNDENGIIVVEVTKGDFDKVIEFPIFKYSAELSKRLTEEEKGYVEKLQPFKGKTISSQKLAAEIFNVSSGRVTQIMKGRQDRNQDGLIHHFAIDEVSIYGDDGTRTNQKGYMIPANLPNIKRTSATEEKKIAEWHDSIEDNADAKPVVKSQPKEPEPKKKLPENPDFLKACGLE